jgi:MYXO-CTERM domain-containing protein
MRKAFLFPIFGVLVGTATLGHAAVPSGKMVMLDTRYWDSVTDQAPASNLQLTYREAIEAGISGLHVRPGHSALKSGYKWRDTIADAHRHGMWVAGATGMGPNIGWQDTLTVTSRLAEAGVDFIQIDEPMGHGMTEAQYIEIKAAAHEKNPDCTVLITDVFYNATVAGWPSVQGLIQEVYIDDWVKYIDETVAYQAAHPNQATAMWVWLPERLAWPELPCASQPDSKFDSWFNASFDKVGKTLLFIFDAREQEGDPCSFAANWDARAATIAAKTAPYRVSLPEWDGFVVTGASDGSPDVSVKVRSPGAGIDPASVKAFYSTDAGVTWTEWQDVECTGTHGVKTWQTVTARNVPFQQVSTTQNKVRFQITDTYAGNYYRNARTDRKAYDVAIDEIIESDGGVVDAETDADGESPTDSESPVDAKTPVDAPGAEDAKSASEWWSDPDEEESGCACRAAGSQGGPEGLLALVSLVLVAFRRRMVS